MTAAKTITKKAPTKTARKSAAQINRMWLNDQGEPAFDDAGLTTLCEMYLRAPTASRAAAIARVSTTAVRISA